MRILHVVLVLNEIKRPFGLADIVIIGAYPAEQPIRANGLRRRFRQVADHHAVMIGSRRFRKQLAQQGMVRIRQLHKLQCRQNPEGSLEERHQTDNQHGRQQAAGKRKANRI
ncbi:hypothetical protein D3C75_937130 [compost metagenome]